MQPSPAVFEVFGHIAWFADWMVEHTKTGDVLYVDCLVSNALEVQFVGDFEACTQAAQAAQEDKKREKVPRMSQ